MRTALLIADLEGVAGVDQLEALAYGGEGHPEACALMTAEVNAAIDGLTAQGFDLVRVSDSHRSGSGAPNLSPGQLRDAAQLHFVDPDYYGGSLLAGVDAIACVGMHAAGGTNGFAAHTVQLHTAWILGGRPISETEIAWWLAADASVPAVFSSGDDVLGAEVRAQAPHVVTKQSKAIDRARSNRNVPAQLLAAARHPPVALKKAPPGPLTLRFKTERQADAAGGLRTGPFEIELRGKAFTDRYRAALEAAVATEGILAEEVDAMPGTRAFAACASRLLLQPFPKPQKGRAKPKR